MDTINSAKNIWDFLKINQDLTKSDLILVLGNSDIRTVDKAVELYKKNYANKIIITGGLGRISSNLFDKPEAVVFKNIAVQKGVKDLDIEIESNSTNTFDNFRFTKKMIDESKVSVKSIIIVTKPYMEKRAYLMAKEIFHNTNLTVTSPDIEFSNYPNQILTKEFVINMLVGEIQRMIIYASHSEIEKVNMPKDILQNYNYLIEKGYTKQLLESNILTK